MAQKKGAAQPNAGKVQAVEALMEQLDQFPNLIVTEYQGLTVKQMTQLRRELRQVGASYVVAKNNLVKIALHNRGNTKLDGVLFGPTGVALAGEDLVTVAKVLTKFQKTADALKLKGGMMGGEPLSATDVQAVANLPSKEELYAKMLWGINTPAQKLAAAFQDMAGRIVRCVDQRAKQLAG